MRISPFAGAGRSVCRRVRVCSQLGGRAARGGGAGAGGGDSFGASLDFVKTALRALVAAPDDDDSDDDDGASDGSSSDESSEEEDEEAEDHGDAQGSLVAMALPEPPPPKPCCLVLVLERFEAFAEEGRQTLLYALLDLRHEKGLHLIVVAVNTHTHAHTGGDFSGTSAEALAFKMPKRDAHTHTVRMLPCRQT